MKNNQELGKIQRETNFGELLASSVEDDLACLQMLRDHGVITPDEYLALTTRVNAKNNDKI